VNHLEQIKYTIKQTITLEATALQDLANNISDEFCEAIDFIYKSGGKVVVTGMGKSAIIAQKIVATMNSTGTTAIFLHAADALHGDIGVIDKSDVVICLSKSGNTPEIKALVPIIKSFGNKIIAVTANENSFLANASDFRIITPINEEADPNNLAPTVSTTSQIAVGDAIAVSLLKLKGFTPEQFAKFHPGGSLGRQLYLRVHDVYINNKKPLVTIDDNIRTIILSLTSGMLGATAVLDSNSEVVGIITDGDIRRTLENHIDVSDLTAKDIMGKNPKSIESPTLAVDALNLMRNNSISQLLVIDGKTYKGIIHLHNLIKEGII
jgi:arabinose-5-phosphate isomerase